MALTFLVLFGITLLVAVHPYTTYPLSLRVLSKLNANPGRPKSIAPSVTPAPHEDDRSIAILLCVHNEEAVIETKIQNLLQLSSGLLPIKILIYDDGSTDGTENILHKFRDRIVVFGSKERRGKTHGMNFLVAKTSAHLLVFTDATVQMDSDSLIKMLAYFDDPTVGCVCGRIIPVTRSSKNPSAARVSANYWQFDARIRQLETRVASVIGAHGPLFAIRGSLHKMPPDDVIDDFYVSLAILNQGFRVIQGDNFLGYKTVATRRMDEYRRKTRIACQSFHVHSLLKPQLKQQTWLIRYLYSGHKTLRWFTIFFLMAAALFGSLTLWLNDLKHTLLYGWVCFAAFLMIGSAGLKPFAAMLDILLALIANGMGFIQAMRGHRYQTWVSAKSARYASRR